MDIPPGSEAREYLDLMERELKRVANIIRQMYGLYRRQVLYNVIINAMDASPDNSTVVTHLYQDGDNAIIDIMDEGKRVNAVDAARIFEPFYTTKETFSGQGLGLGLPVSASIIRSLRGQISLQSKEDTGTLCRIILPLKSTAAGSQ